MGLPVPAADFPIKIRVSKGLSGSAAWHMAQKNIVQVIFVRWRGDSKIVEANAEHDFRLKRLIGMLRTIEKQNKFCAQIFRAICQTTLPDRPFGTRILYGKKVWHSQTFCLFLKPSQSTYAGISPHKYHIPYIFHNQWTH